MKTLDVIVIGGGISGLSATLTLARALLRVVCIDGSEPCNRYARESHNFVTNDGKSPGQILQEARDDIQRYDTVEIVNGTVTNLQQLEDKTFIVEVGSQQSRSSRLILATGVTDLISLSGIKNIEKFWGGSIIGCPYCHGYEVKGLKTAVLAPDNPFLPIFEFVQTLYNWSKDISVIIRATKAKDLIFTKEQLGELEKNKVKLVEKEIVQVDGKNGKLESITFEDGTTERFGAAYYHPKFQLNCKLMIEKLGVELNEQTGLIKVNSFQMTNLPNVFACGDNTTFLRALAGALSQGFFAGTVASKGVFADKWNSSKLENSD